MTVGQQDMYGTRLERKNIPPPLSLPNFSYPLSFQQHHISVNNPMPKSAPPQSTNTDLMQLQLQLMLQNESKTPAPFSNPPQLQTQFSTPSPLQTQFSTPSSLPSNFAGSNLGMYSNPPMSPLVSMNMDSPGMMGMGMDPVGSPQLQDQGKNSASRYKTELCRPYAESGGCKYGEKCQFAHGINELRNLSRHPKYKTEMCKTFHTIGFCPYGPRCHFIHNSDEKRAPPISPGPHNSGTNATLQSLPALLSLFQQSSNVNKVLGLLSKMPLQIGGKEGDEMLQYLNINFANMMTPPNTPNMFNFPEYIVPAAQAINQASRPSASGAITNTSNIHSYINFNIAPKDSHLAGLLSAANIHPPQQPQQVAYPPQASSAGSPAGTPPLQMSAALSTGTLSSESSPMSDKSSDQHYLPSTRYHGDMMHRGYPNSDKQIFSDPQQQQHVKLSTEYMMPARVIQESSTNGKRLPIFNQLSDPVC